MEAMEISRTGLDVEPGYEVLKALDLPVVRGDGSLVRVYSGHTAGVTATEGRYGTRRCGGRSEKAAVFGPRIFGRKRRWRCEVGLDRIDDGISRRSCCSHRYVYISC